MGLPKIRCVQSIEKYLDVFGIRIKSIDQYLDITKIVGCSMGSLRMRITSLAL